MPHLLHIDTSVQGDRSASRELTDLAARRWLDTHSGGTVTYRDYGANPLPHLNSATGPARNLPADQHTEEQAASYDLTVRLVDEIKSASAVLLGMPLYNYGPPSSVKAWADHIVAAGLSWDPGTHEGLLGGRDFIVLASRGGGYGPGTPREGWDHATPWISHIAQQVGLDAHVIAAELTMAKGNPAMSELQPLAEESHARAVAEIGRLWSDA